jgi:hypothetical protein
MGKWIEFCFRFKPALMMLWRSAKEKAASISGCGPASTDAG